MTVLLFCAAFVTLLVTAGVLYQQYGRHRDAVRFPAPGRMVDIGDGTRMHLWELGSSAGPTVVFEAGLCATSLNWRSLQQAIAPFARVIAYDRAGLGWSDSGKGARTPLNLTLELRSLLEAADIEPPYIFVGHSFGSFVVQRFASLYREDVAGVVLLDPLQPAGWSPISLERHHTLERGIRLASRGMMLARCGVIRCAISFFRRGAKFLPRAIDTAATGRTHALARVTEQAAKMPRELWPMIAAHWSNPRFFETAVSYLESLPASAREMADAAPLGGMPVVVITATKKPSVERADIKAMAPNAFHIRAARSGHWIHLDEPDLVAGVIRDMIENAREEFAAPAVFPHARTA